MTTLVEGKNGISAKVLAKSSSPQGKIIVSYELEFPRWILAEFNTHRMISKNGASSRAIPLKTAIENVQKWNVKPIRWGKNQAGMQAAPEDLSLADQEIAEGYWKIAKEEMCTFAWDLGGKLNLHKQWSVRLLEPFSLMKMVATGTEWENFFWLRNHEAAQPEFHELARCMLEAVESHPTAKLNYGDFHLPYYGQGFWSPDCKDSLEDAKAISVSCCAQTSYRKSDDSLEKAYSIIEKLTSTPPHLSPFEHQATPIEGGWKDPAVTHEDRYENLWSGNFQGWSQLRKLIMAEKGLNLVSSYPLS